MCVCLVWFGVVFCVGAVGGPGEDARKDGAGSPFPSAILFPPCDWVDF